LVNIPANAKPAKGGNGIEQVGMSPTRETQRMIGMDIVDACT